MARKECQQIEFLRRKCTFFSVHPHTSCSCINLQSSDLDHFILLCRTSGQTVVSCQMRFYSRHQFTWTKRLCHIIIRTESQSPDLIDIIFLRRHHHDRCILHITHLTADIESVRSRQHQIQDQKIIIFVQGFLKSCISVICNLYGEPAQFQIIPFQICNCFFVFYY